jgi:hypothetical protein
VIEREPATAGLSLDGIIGYHFENARLIDTTCGGVGQFLIFEPPQTRAARISKSTVRQEASKI